MCDAPVIKHKRDDENKPKPGEKGFKRTEEQAQKAYEKWKKRQEQDKARGIRYDLTKLMETGEKKPLNDK